MPLKGRVVPSLWSRMLLLLFCLSLLSLLRAADASAIPARGDDGLGGELAAERNLCFLSV